MLMPLTVKELNERDVGGPVACTENTLRLYERES